MRRKKISIPLVEFESKVPVIKLTLGDRNIFALIDTGSESTLFDEHLRESKEIKSKELDSDMSFVGLHGKTDKKKVIILSGEFDGINITGISADLSSIAGYFKRSYDSDIVISILLGCDFLETYDAVVDFEEHMLFLYEK